MARGHKLKKILLAETNKLIFFFLYIYLEKIKEPLKESYVFLNPLLVLISEVK
jgi:hypothetical protein